MTYDPYDRYRDIRRDIQPRPSDINESSPVGAIAALVFVAIIVIGLALLSSSSNTPSRVVQSEVPPTALPPNY
jgi:hypothetical protein